MNKTISRIAVSLALALLITLSATLIPLAATCTEIRERVFRLHVVANSDSERDQALKLLVRDALIEKTSRLFADAVSSQEAEAIAANAAADLTEIAQQTLRANGSTETVTVSVGPAWFDTREYDGFALPAGTYEALRVVIGEGQGHNWWCVLFPAVCLPSAKADIGDALDEEATAFVKGKTRYKAAFRLVEWVEELRQKWNF